MESPPAGAQGPRRPDFDPAVSPHSAPDLPLFRVPPPRRAPLRIALGAAAAAAIVAGVVWWGLAPRTATLSSLEGAQEGRVLEPLRPRADVGTGEQVAPFSGFAVSVDSDPAGAIVTVAGVPRGEAPALAGVECSPGDKVEISVEKAGFAVARERTTCRADTLVKLTVRLHR
jgi:hypothetical protein